MIPKNFPEGEMREEYFKKLFRALQTNLFLYNSMKSKFEKKKKLIPYTTLSVNNFDEMYSIRDKKAEFVQRAYLLGFPRGKKPYTGIRGKVLTEYDQAIDYVNLLFYFDATLNETISEQIKSKRKLGPFYRYINSLGE